MLHANRLTVKSGTTNQTIAGQSGGRKVICSPRALNTYNDLLHLAKVKSNYWALLIVKAIDGLASGRLNKDNVYIEKKMSLAYGKGAFHLVLPGVMASLEEIGEGSYILQNIKADTNYMEQQKRSQEPGMWRISELTNQKPEFQADGEVKSEKYRPVVISDMAIDLPQDIASGVRDDLANINGTIKSMVNSNGFDLHHTPGDSSIIGLKKAKDALADTKNIKITKSAMLLANSMYKARNIDGVMWYSDFGGSAVLTRAMQILHSEKNITLEKHAIFLNRPTSTPKEIMELAKKIGITPLNKGSVSGLSKEELLGRISEVTPKGLKNATGTVIGGAGIGYGVAGLAGLASPALTTAGIGAALFGFAGALIEVSKTASAGKKIIKQKQYK